MERKRAKVSEQTINQRLKFLVERLAPSTREFSEALGESSGNTQNYIGARQVVPGYEYLSKVLKHFSSVNATWLMTGQGEPFTGVPPASQSLSTRIKKNNQSPIIGNNSGEINYLIDECRHERDEYKFKLEKAQSEITLLREQLQRADALVAAKEETISLLRGSYKNPN
jgi:hypothetical protein